MEEDLYMPPEQRSDLIPQWVMDWGYLAAHEDPKVRAAAQRLYQDWREAYPKAPL